MSEIPMCPDACEHGESRPDLCAICLRAEVARLTTFLTPPAPPDALCNLCGLTCALHGADTREVGLHGLINCQVSGGYHSTAGNGYGALDDGETYRFNLCEFCLDWLFTHFQIPIEVGNYTGRGSEKEVWRPAAVRVRDDAWRKLKTEFAEEADRRALARTGKGPA